MMKNKGLKILLVAICLFSLTGCTKYVKNDKKIVKNEITGQSLTENILCQPTEKGIIELYSENNINIKKLPKCEKMNVVSNDYDGLWTTIFVQPLAWLIIQIGKLIKMIGMSAGTAAGVSLIVSTLLIRGIMYPLTKKSAMQSENMK